MVGSRLVVGWPVTFRLNVLGTEAGWADEQGKMEGQEAGYFDIQGQTECM